MKIKSRAQVTQQILLMDYLLCFVSSTSLITPNPLLHLNPLPRPPTSDKRSKHPPSGSSQDAVLTRLRQNPTTNTCQEEEAARHSPWMLIRFGESARQLIQAIIYEDRLSDRKVKFTTSAGGMTGIYCNSPGDF